VLQRQAQESVTRTSTEVSEMSSEPQTEARSEEVRYRSTASKPIGGPANSETAVQAAEVAQVAAAPPPSPTHDVDEQDAKRLHTREDDDGSERRLLNVMMSTLSWNNDIRLDPLIIVVIITILYL